MTLSPSQVIERADRIRALAEAGLAGREIAAQMGLHYQTIRLTCRAFGINPIKKYDGTRVQKARAQSKARAEQIIALYRAGYTLQQIGEQNGITRERVRQLMSKHFKTTKNDGGQHAKAMASAERRTARLNAQSLKKWGMTFDEYRVVRDMKKPTRAFASQKRNAHKRGIAWELTLGQWWAIWKTSGHWEQRGRGNGYMMCRKGDTGPYSVDNIYIATGVENTSHAMVKTRKDPDLPIGISRTKSGKFHAMRSVNGKPKGLGTFPTVESAHAAWLMARPAPKAERVA